MNNFKRVLLSLTGALLLQGVPASAVQQGVVPSAELRREFVAATDWRAFAQRAMNRPREGGVFYALYATNSCGRDFNTISKFTAAAIDKEIAAKSTITAARLELMTESARRCSAFVAGEIEDLYLRLKERAPSSGDPLIAARQQVMAAYKSGKAEAMRAAVARLMELDDPLLWTDGALYTFVVRADPEVRKKGAVFFNGVVYDSDVDSRSFQEATIALDLGFCRQGSYCAADDMLRVACASGGDCADNRTEKAKQFLMANGGTEEAWMRVEELTRKIQAALARKDVSFFVR